VKRVGMWLVMMTDPIPNLRRSRNPSRKHNRNLNRYLWVIKSDRTRLRLGVGSWELEEGECIYL